MDIGEPNVPDLNELCNFIEKQYGKGIADRTHKCLLACTGMNDEEVERILTRIEGMRDALIDQQTQIAKLGPDLNQAVGLLKQIRYRGYYFGNNHEDMDASIDKILARMEASK